MLKETQRVRENRLKAWVMAIANKIKKSDKGETQYKNEKIK